MDITNVGIHMYHSVTSNPELFRSPTFWIIIAISICRVGESKQKEHGQITAPNSHQVTLSIPPSCAANS